MGRVMNDMQYATQEQTTKLVAKEFSHSKDVHAKYKGTFLRRSGYRFQAVWLLGVVFVLAMLQSGCGAGGYAGGGIGSLTVSKIAIDAGQSMAVGAEGSGNLQVQWTLSGASCSGAACGTLSSSTGTTITYTAPPSLAAPVQATLIAAVAGTQNQHTVAVNVNPAPVLSGNPPAGNVGVPYSFAFTTTGGTPALKLSLQSGTLPAGLTFDPATGKVSGMPSESGTSTFVLQLDDSSDVPYMIKATKQITINSGTTGAAMNVVSANLPTGVVGTAYNGILRTSGGTAPYTWAVMSGSLPAGLTLNAATGAISGTPTVAGTSTFTAQAIDAEGAAASGPFSITIFPAAPSAPVITNGTLPNGTVSIPYSATIAVSGGTSPYTCALISGTLPAGLTLNPACTVTGTPTTAATSTFNVKVTDSGNPAQSVTGPQSITINPAQGLTLTSPVPATAGTPYTGTIGVGNGTAPYTCSLVSGTVPAGLTLHPDCTITGTPVAPGTVTVIVKGYDSGNPAKTGTAPVTITVNAAPLALTNGTLPNGTVNILYSASVGVSGGTAPYSCVLVSGTLPAGLVMDATCTVSGTPTIAGTSTVNVRVTDSANPAQTITGAETITINPAALSLTNGTLPDGTVGIVYTANVAVSGGTSPYTCQLTNGTLPAGLTLNANCSVTGTPTVAGTSTVNVRATDSANPARTITGPETITINPAALSLTNGTLPDGTVGIVYTANVAVSGGTSPYTCQLTNGTLPAGLTLNANCSVTGTPTVAGTSTVNVRATDSANPARSITGPETITINPAALSLANGTLPNGTVGIVYTANVAVSGGTGPYTCQLTNGTLPAGLTLNANCSVTGTPTVAGTSSITVNATDSSNPVLSTSGTQTITINPAPSLTISSPPAATVNTPYTGTIPVAGGTAPYTCVLASGTLPANLTLNANCTVTGTPTVAGSSTVQVTGTDSSNPAHTNTGNVTVTVNPAPLTLTLGNPPDATVSTPYTGSIPVSGGTAPYTCLLASSTLPAGLTLNANCTVTGTPATAGSSTFQVTATDSANPAHTNTGNVTVLVQPLAPVTLTGSLPNAVVNQPYTQTLQAAGGVGPYTYTLTAGSLPNGITLSSTGVISGTPTAVGASSFTVTATDSQGTPQSASLPLMLLVTYAPAPNNTLLQGPYAFLFQGYDDVVAGVLAYQTATAGSITADGNGVITAGEQDSNHQGSNPAGKTVRTSSILGTYTVGADRRGLLSLTTLNADGTVATTTTYAIALKAPVAPATNATAGSLIEFDGNQLAGTKGSGMVLAQTASAFSTGLTGSYAFGVKGDTPCLPSCTIGIAAGPVATVGQFTAAANTITGGTADTNITSTATANSTLSGTYTAADTNGRIELNLVNAKLAGVAYPTDFAAYVVDANSAILLSTDKHSAYILQAGTAALQTQGTFSNASLGSAFVGYENSPVNPGLLGTTLQNVLNLSTATVFRGTGNGNGSCTTTNVDSSGTTGVVNGLGGIVNAPLVNALLGSYQSLGSSQCTVAANGRAVLDYPAPNALLSLTLSGLGLPTVPSPRVAYLTAPNQGYFLETGYAGLGMLEAQTGAPYTPAGLNGTYVYSSVPASSLATINSSGTFTADGAGSTTSTVDRNVGVGTINVLQLGVTATATYTLTDTAAGRYLLSSGEVIYEIAPGRFVLLEPQLLNTSAYVALLF